MQQYGQPFAYIRFFSDDTIYLAYLRKSTGPFNLFSRPLFFHSTFRYPIVFISPRYRLESLTS